MILQCPDGTQLEAPNDLLMAWKWAEYAHGSQWAELGATQQAIEVSAALQTLRELYWAAKAETN
jgi:hypothetical protein